MRLHQFHPVVAERDAIGHEMVALRRLLASWGIEGGLLAAHGGEVLGETVTPIGQFRPGPGDALLVHFSAGSEWHDRVAELPVRRFLLYHNITPAEHFRHCDPAMELLANLGRRQLERMLPVCESAIAHSHFSAADLTRFPSAQIFVVPYLELDSLWSSLPPELPVAPEGEVFRILTVGRLSPHKRLEECLFVLDHLNRHSVHRWELRVVGDPNATPPYYRRLRALQERLELPNAIFTGSLTQRELQREYLDAHAFLSMSAHEGFCVPLVEAMRIGRPVFAIDCGPTREVLGETGMIFEERDWGLIAEAIGVMVEDQPLRDESAGQLRQRAREFSPQAVAAQWRQWLEHQGLGRMGAG